MATTISSGTNPYKLGSPPDFGTLYSGRALEFDGATDYVSTSFTGITSFPFTFSVWVYVESHSTTGNIMCLADSDSNPRYTLDVTSDQYLRAYAHDGTTYGSVTHGDTSTAKDLNDGKWHYVVAVFDTSNVQRIYLDGVLIETGALDETFNTDANEFNLSTHQTATPEAFFNGKITNAQVWDKVWSLSDVQYDYTHPEKLITHNSAVTSGTTISNLKAWYPCTEGNPRSPQTTVYDGSPKELGSELVTNGDLSSNPFAHATDYSGGWSDTSIGSSEATWSSGNQTISIIGDGGGSNRGNATMRITAVSGKVYKISYTNSTTPANSNLRVGTVNSWSSSDVVSITPSSNEVHYFRSTVSAYLYITFSTYDANIWTFGNVSVKEVQMGNHGTTTFYGDELVTNGDFNTDISSWTATGTPVTWERNTSTPIDGSGDAHYVASASVALNGIISNAVSLTSGRTYRIT